MERVGGDAPEEGATPGEALTALALEAVPEAVLVVDSEERVLGANRRAERLFTRPLHELLGGPAGRLFPAGFFEPGDRRRARVECGEAGEAPTRVLQVLRPDGSHALVEGRLAARPAAGSGGWVYVATLRDVAATRRAEEGLRRSEASFRGLIETLPDGVGVLRAGRLVYVNPALCALTGAGEPRELLGRRWLDFVHPEDRAGLEDASSTLQSGTPAGGREVRMLSPDGLTRWAEVGLCAVEHDGQPAVAFLARDVSARRHMQLAMVQADRLSSVGTLAAGVAHEINNPLTYVITNLGFVASELDKLEAWFAGSPNAAASARLKEVRDAVAESREGADRVRIIARDLKTFSRADEGRRERVDVRRVLESSINMARNEIRHRARLERDYAPVGAVQGHEARLGQVFLNLLLNAAQAIPEGSAAEHEIRLVLREAAGEVIVEVHDTGVGVPPELRERLFDPFFTTKPAGVGTGLGLAVCASIVRGLGGRVEIDPQVRRGAVFRVYLPAAPEFFEEEPTSPGAPIPAVPRGRVLIIDDEPAVGAAAARALREDHEVVTITRPKEALRRIIDGETFDLVLCDVMMPETSGMDVYAALERLAPGVLPRLVFLTGGAFTPRARAFLDSVANARIDKPFEEEALRRFVQLRLSVDHGG